MLVLRGYLDRQINPDDRRRMDIEFTERGRAAAVVIRAAIEKIDKRLTATLSATGWQASAPVSPRLPQSSRRPKTTENQRTSEPS